MKIFISAKGRLPVTLGGLLTRFGKMMENKNNKSEDHTRIFQRNLIKIE